MKLISWNVNGIRAAIKKGFYDFAKEQNPDVICLQETKAHPEQVDLQLDQYEYHFWNSAVKKGYSGTAIFSKVEPISVTYGLGIEEHDQEGRVITLEFEKFHLVNVYTPNSKRELLRLEYRTTKWDVLFLEHMQKLEKTKPVIVCGDLNVAHKEIDLKNDKTNHMNPGFTDEERASFDNFLNAGFVDTFRHLYPDEIKYSWWSYMFNARKNNAGWRIDYFLTSGSFIDEVTDAFILNDVHGSDHCPVGITLKK